MVSRSGHAAAGAALAGVLLTLAACSGSPSEDADEATVGTEAPDVATPSPEPTVSPTTTDPDAVPTVAAGTGIPQPVRGQWGINDADCTGDASAAKGLIMIGPDRVEFYESVARLGRIKERDDSRIRATFDFTGEGQTWTMDMVLDAQDNGDTLVRRDYGPDAMPGPLRYKRCRG